MSTRRKSATRGWHKQAPGKHARTVMRKRCGTTCFLGPNKTFPICRKNTCKVDRRGVQSAYNRARQWNYTAIAKKAKKLLQTFKRRYQ